MYKKKKKVYIEFGTIYPQFQVTAGSPHNIYPVDNMGPL